MPDREKIPWSVLEDRAGTTDVDELAKMLRMKATSVARQKVRGVVPAHWLIRLAGGMSGPDDTDEAPETSGPAGSEISFQAGFRFPGMNPTAIVRDGKIENVRAFLAWCRDIAEMAERAARASGPSGARPSRTLES
jgi:hypothetical protein